MTHGSPAAGPLHVVVAGGGIAGVEALLAVRELAGDRVVLTLVSPSRELVLPALSVAEVFALGRAQRYPLDGLLARVQADLVCGAVAAVDQPQRQIVLTDDTRLAFDALVMATGARPVARVEHATTWWPRADAEALGRLLRDLEGGDVKRVAFVIPPGAVWPLPLYEIALMTARQVAAAGADAELTVITPEATPLALFGPQAAAALHDELTTVGIRLVTATVARVERDYRLQVVLQPSVRRLEVDRVIALPGVEGPRIPGTAQNRDGFILVGPQGRMRDSESVWAAGDGVAYPVKYGGLAAQQADIVAADIARRAGADAPVPPTHLALTGVLMTGAMSRRLGSSAPSPGPAHERMWQPADKVLGKYLTPYLGAVAPSTGHNDGRRGILVEEKLAGSEAGRAETFHALWRAERGDPDVLRRLGHDMHEYEARHQRTASILREHGQLPRRR